MEQNFKKENMMMCDVCGHVFIASPNQRKNWIESNKIICRPCEKFEDMQKEMHENYAKGRE